jgi:hypothetical protein
MDCFHIHLYYLHKKWGETIGKYNQIYQLARETVHFKTNLFLAQLGLITIILFGL